jgi:hypothetical protein
MRAAWRIAHNNALWQWYVGGRFTTNQHKSFRWSFNLVECWAEGEL